MGFGYCTERIGRAVRCPAFCDPFVSGSQLYATGGENDYGFQFEDYIVLLIQYCFFLQLVSPVG